MPGLRIERAIMHHLDPRNNTFILVGEEIALNSSLENMLCQLMDVSLSKADTHAVDATNSSHVLHLCRTALIPGSDFISLSQEIAERLYAAMSSHSFIVAGDLLVTIACDENGNFISVLKTEPANEMQVKYAKRPNGTSYVEIEPTGNLVPSKDRLPQKCGFVRDRQFDNGADVWLVDHQSQSTDGNVAKFFYETFFGCRLLATNAARTLTFCRATEIWRCENAKYLPQQGFVGFTRALFKHLRNSVIDFRSFADDALNGYDNPWINPTMLVEELRSKVFADIDKDRPMTLIPDFAVVSKLLDHMNLSLVTGVQITGSTEELLKILRVEESSGMLDLTLTTPSVKRNFHKPKR